MALRIANEESAQGEKLKALETDLSQQEQSTETLTGQMEEGVKAFDASTFEKMQALSAHSVERVARSVDRRAGARWAVRIHDKVLAWLRLEGRPVAEA